MPKLPEYRTLGCAQTKNRSLWCNRVCQPDESGKGECGRIAPHSIKSRIQQAIEKHERNRSQ